MQKPAQFGKLIGTPSASPQFQRPPGSEVPWIPGTPKPLCDCSWTAHPSLEPGQAQYKAQKWCSLLCKGVEMWTIEDATRKSIPKLAGTCSRRGKRRLFTGGVFNVQQLSS